MDSIYFIAYDTTCSIHISVDDDVQSNRILSKCRDIALEVHSTLNMFDEISEISKMCRSYYTDVPYFVSGMLFDFLTINLKIARLTGGVFDPTIAPVIKLWRFSDDMTVLPDADKIAQALSRVGYEHIFLNQQDRSVEFNMPGMEIDPGAAGKGFALGLVVDYLRSQGVDSGYLDFGGNLYVLGEKHTANGSRPWSIATADPDDKSRIIGGINLKDGGVATSSWYEHYHEIDGVIYHHIIDTQTGMPCALKLKSVTIISSNAVYTDLLSTPLFLLGEKQGCELIDRIRAETGKTIEYVIVRNDGSVLASQGAGFYV